MLVNACICKHAFAPALTPAPALARVRERERIYIQVVLAVVTVENVEKLDFPYGIREKCC